MYFFWILKYSVKGQVTSLNKNCFQRYSTSASLTHYDILGVGRQANTKEIKQAYISMSKKLHPDANPGDAQAQQKFVRLREAYNVLSDPKERTSYDVQMYKDLQSRARVNKSYTTTHSTEHMSEQEVIQRYYKQHQEMYEEWIRKSRSQSGTNTHQQQYYNSHKEDPKQWMGQGGFNPHGDPKHWAGPDGFNSHDDPKDWARHGGFNPHEELKARAFYYMNKLSVADLFLITALGKVAGLFILVYFLYIHYRKF
ncbi:uncharacterized protein LOC133181593 [Saccostrea echinata]|uniref:uncharacterized protein LOC133181593 n=1 Tax=Saccostrea echinata TaxID=191078 RepID=UPI002A802D73|nr:uncharacterized protein LOC133181593 [Saccostrea echinata]